LSLSFELRPPHCPSNRRNHEYRVEPDVGTQQEEKNMLMFLGSSIAAAVAGYLLTSATREKIGPLTSWCLTVVTLVLWGTVGNAFVLALPALAGLVCGASLGALPLAPKAFRLLFSLAPPLGRGRFLRSSLARLFALAILFLAVIVVTCTLDVLPGRNAQRSLALEVTGAIGLGLVLIAAPILHVPLIIRRLHSLGRPTARGWLLLVPVVNIYWIFLLYFGKGVGPERSIKASDAPHDT
jgi:hypothetical protein